MARMRSEPGVAAVNKRQPVGTAPFAYLKTTNPSGWKVGGYVDAKGSGNYGGNMNDGGKRRPTKAKDARID